MLLRTLYLQCPVGGGVQTACTWLTLPCAIVHPTDGSWSNRIGVTGYSLGDPSVGGVVFGSSVGGECLWEAVARGGRALAPIHLPTTPQQTGCCLPPCPAVLLATTLAVYYFNKYLRGPLKLE